MSGKKNVTCLIWKSSNLDPGVQTHDFVKLTELGSLIMNFGFHKKGNSLASQHRSAFPGKPTKQI